MSNATTMPSAEALLDNAGVLLGCGAAAFAAAAWRLRRRAAAPARWDADDPPARLWIIACVAFVIAQSAPALRAVIAGEPSSDAPGGAAPQAGMIAAHLLAVLAGLTALLALNAVSRAGSLSRLGLRGRDAWAGLRDGALAAIGLVPLTAGASLLAQHLWLHVLHRAAETHALLAALDGAGLAARAALVLSAVLVGPLYEELLYRGHVQTTLCRAFGRGPGIAVASLIFAAVHLQGWMLLPLFVLSCAIGWVYERTGSLWSAWAIHALFNGAALAVAMVGGGG